MSMTPPMPRNLSFRVETLFTKNGSRVGKIRCEENGIYKGLPMMVMGETTQQKTYYDPQSMVEQITSPTSRFNLMYTSGKLYGEYGHPNFNECTGDTQTLQRLTTIDEKNVSHVFTGLYTDPPSADGTIVVRGDLKPTGPYGAIFKEGLEDPVVNTAFSLRAFVDTKIQPNGVKFRTVRSLVTWDTVGASGYKTTDKAHSLGLESFGGTDFLDYEIKVLEDGNLMIDQVALESFSNTDLNEIFGTSSVSRIIQSRTFVEVDKSLAERYPNLYRKSVFNDYFKEV